MKKVLSGVVVAAAVMIAPLLAVAAGNAPAEIDLKAKHSIQGDKAAVVFKHAMHQEKLKDCTKCHKDATGGPLKVTIENTTGVKNDFHEKLCFPCHTEMNVPKGKACSTCHAK